MFQNADRYLPGPDGSADYWRRRAIALAVGLAVFGLIAWAVNGTLSGPGSTQTASVTKAAGRARPGTAAGASGGGAGAAGAVPASPLSAAAPRAGRDGSGHRGGTVPSAGRPHGTRGHQGTRGHHGGGRQAAQGAHRGSHQGVPGRHGMPGACTARNVVLSLRQPHRAYGPAGSPSFTAEVISTAPGRCTFNARWASLALVIRAGAGQAPWWSSADCARGPAARTRVLIRGVPALLYFRWDRKTASPGCGRPRRPVQPGTYLATVVSGHTSSNSLIFVLRGRRRAVR